MEGLRIEDYSATGLRVGLDVVPRPQEEVRELRPHRASLASLLTDAGILSEQRVTEALQEGMQTGEKLGEVIVRRGWVDDEQLAQVLAEQWGLPFCKAVALAVDPQAARALNAADARRLGALPAWFERVDAGPGEQQTRLMVAIAEPSEERFRSIAELVGGNTEVGYMVVAGSVLERLLRSRLVDPPVDVHAEPDQLEHAPVEPLLPETAPVVAPIEPVEAVPHEQAPAEPVPERAPPVDSIEPVGAVPNVQPPVEPGVPEIADVIGAIEEATGRLRAIEAEFATFAATLREREERLAEQVRRVTVAEAVSERDRETIGRLEDELAQRTDLLSALKTKVAELSRALDTTP